MSCENLEVATRVKRFHCPGRVRRGLESTAREVLEGRVLARGCVDDVVYCLLVFFPGMDGPCGEAGRRDQCRGRGFVSLGCFHPWPVLESAVRFGVGPTFGQALADGTMGMVVKNGINVQVVAHGRLATRDAAEEASDVVFDVTGHGNIQCHCMSILFV